MNKTIVLSILGLAAAASAYATTPSFTVFPEPENPVDNLYMISLKAAEPGMMYMYAPDNDNKAYLTYVAEGSGTEQTITLYQGYDRSCIELIPERVVYTPGVCELVIPAGAIIGFDSEYNEISVDEPLSYKFTIEGNTGNPETLPFTVTPSSGSSVALLEITFNSTDENVGMTPNGNGFYSNIYFAKGGRMVCLADAEPSDDGLSMTVTPTKEITDPGTYDLIVAYGGLYYYNPSDIFPSATPNTEPMFFSYTLKWADEPAGFSANPSQGATVKNIDKVTLVPAEGTIGLSCDMYGTTKAYFKVDGEFFCEATCAPSIEDFNALEISPEMFIYAPGECELVMEAGFLSWVDAEGAARTNTEDLIYKYDVTGGVENPTDLPFAILPAEDITLLSLDAVTVSVDEGYTLMFDDRLSELFYFAQAGKKLCGAKCSMLPDNLTLRISPETGLTQDGSYDLVIMPMGLSYLDADYEFGFNTTALCYRYKVDSNVGVAGVNAVSDDGEVYNLYGVRMNTPFESLAPGIYIRDGKKMVKK